jgi:hypothetical protein
MMNKALILILLPLLLMGCSHKQLRTYMPDSDTKKNEKAVQRINLSEFNVALIVKSDPVPVNSFNKTIIPVMPGINLFLTTDDAVLDKSRKDLKNFYITAKHLRMSNMGEDLEIYAEVVKEYLSKRIDPLLKDKSDDHSPEVKRALTELQYYKAHLLYEIEDLDSACETVSNLESSDYHAQNEDLKILSERFNGTSNSYMVMTEFNNMCK